MKAILLPIDMIRQLQPGESILYRNSYGQLLDGRITRKYLANDGRLFFYVKRESWKYDECLAFSDFENGTYAVISDLKGGAE